MWRITVLISCVQWARLAASAALCDADASTVWSYVDKIDFSNERWRRIVPVYERDVENLRTGRIASPFVVVRGESAKHKVVHTFLQLIDWLCGSCSRLYSTQELINRADLLLRLCFTHGQPEQHLEHMWSV